VIEQGGTAEAAFDTIDGTIDSMTKTAVFSHCKPNPCGETAEEQQHTDHNFIHSRGRDLRPLNNGFISARWVSLHLGTDVRLGFHNQQLELFTVPPMLHDRDVQRTITKYQTHQKPQRSEVNTERRRVNAGEMSLAEIKRSM
jgi:hypothetical protein